MLANYFDAFEPSTENFDFIFPLFLHSNALSDPKDQSHIHRLIHSEEECCQQSDVAEMSGLARLSLVAPLVAA